ncbi:CHAP domain-containing protein [Bradyrhizobium cytisi]|uniref:CHAP domain-containing protein n=1 Tax=Bradyrhizobium cytisi TaxID=515489 RepID=A0A5S4X3A4_9BRAD|nr:CHAP domain-containing protein [Bradyrhizobium cytisi]TYL87443.1 CHAP domain-containing protein [Bradyrhizobium cytisi]
MATEQEELRLTVNLADNASAGLAKLNEEIKQLGSGAGQQHIEKFKRDTAELTGKVKQMGGEVEGAFKNLGMLRTGFAAGAAGLALFGFEIMRQSKALIEYADKIRELNAAAKTIGVNPSQYKDVLEQLKAFGVDGGRAAASLASVSEKMADLQRQGSQVAQELRKNAGPDRQSEQNMEAYIQRLRTAKSEAQLLNTIREGGEQVYQNAIKAGASEMEAANRRNRFWQIQGYDAALAHAGKLKELSAAEQARANQRQKEAVDLANAWGQVTNKYSTLVEKMQQPFVPYLTTALKMAEGMLDSMTTKLDAIQDKKLLRPDTAKENIQEKFGKFGLGGAGPDQSFENRWRDRVPQELEKNTDATKDLTNLLRGLGGGVHPTSFGGGAMGGGGIVAAAYHPDGGGFAGGGGASVGRAFGGGGYTNLETGYSGGGGGSGGGGKPYGSSTGGATGSPGHPGDPAVPSDILATAQKVALQGGPGAVERFMAENGYPKAGNWCGEFAASVVKSVGGTPPQNPAIASNWRNWGTEVQDPQPGDVAVRRGARTGSTGSHVTFVESVGKGSFTGLGGNQGRWESTQQTGRYQFFRGGTTTNGDVAGGQAIPGGGGGEFLRQQRAPLTAQLENDPQLKKELAALGTLEHEGDATAVVESLYNRTTAINEKRAKEGKPPLSLRQMMYGGFYGPSKQIPSRLAQLERDPARMKKMMGAIDAASTSNLLKGATDQGSGSDPNVAWQGGKLVRDGETYNDWGGGAGHEGNRQWRLRQQAAIAAADRRQIDGTQVAEHKVTGDGKISVDVNAPKGTNVGAKGGGLFKRVEINRQTQMSEAPRGPKGSYATEALLQ